MIICVLGSIGQFEDERKFQTSCFEIGKKLAENKHELILCSENTFTADPYIVKGVNSINHKTIITIIRSEEDDRVAPYKSKQSELENITFIHKRCPGGWKATHLNAILECDLLMTIGGKDSVWSAANSATLLNKPVVSIPYFKGTSKDFWDKSIDTYKRYNISDVHIGNVRENWDKKSASSLITIIATVYKKHVASQKKNILPFITVIGVIVLTLVYFWISLFNKPNNEVNYTVYLLFSSVCSLLGIILRRLVQDKMDQPLKKVLSSFLIDAIKGIIVGFVLFISYMLTELIINGNVNSEYSKESFVRIALSVSLTAIYSGFSLNKAIEKIKSLSNETLSKFE